MSQFSEERTRNRFVLCDGKSNQVPKVELKRRNETFNATALIHGATKPKKIPALDGIIDTLGNNALVYCKEVFQKYGQGCYAVRYNN